jgi:hypothetical protein
VIKRHLSEKRTKKKSLKSETFQVRILLVPFEGSKYEYICKYFLNLEIEDSNLEFFNL